MSIKQEEWDFRLDARGVKLIRSSGSPRWQVVRGKWLDENEARAVGPDHHILVDALDEQGKRLTGVSFVVSWPTGATRITTKGNSGYPWAADYPMSGSLNEFSIVAVDGLPSDTVTGIGMGKDGNKNIHTSTLLVFQRVRSESLASVIVLTPAGANIRSSPSLTGQILGAVPQGTVLPVLAEGDGWWRVDSPYGPAWVSATVVMRSKPGPTSPAWDRCISFVLRWENGLSENPQDPGGLTNFGISQRAYPNLDIRNLTVEQAKEIYYRDYWLASGANRLHWPLCLAHFDLAVNGGVERAMQTLYESDSNFLVYVSRRLDWYTRLSTFDVFGKAWVRRCSDLLREGAK